MKRETDRRGERVRDRDKERQEIVGTYRDKGTRSPRENHALAQSLVGDSQDSNATFKAPMPFPKSCYLFGIPEYPVTRLFHIA